MKKLIFALLSGLIFISCTDSFESNKYTGKQVEYSLFKASDFDFSGTATVRELIGGNLEMSIDLEGSRGDTSVSYPAHLHFGNINTPQATIAFMLKPVNAASLKSVTVLEQMTNGNRLLFNELLGFEGHIKVHLAADGPDYNTILVAGNIGKAANASNFDPSQMVICGKDY
ncbi:MAG: hypothetical protein CL555_06820 [Algoriphagus sp.]|nr:hypothetical protein [Algoriphagus sp.]